MTLPDASLFRAYDIRGCATSLLTPAAASAIAGAFAARIRALPDQRVVVGRDGRLSSPALHQAVRQTLVEAGLTVLDIGLVPTPLLYFAQRHFDCGNGVMITGSHNPKHDNGFKLSLNGDPFFGPALRALRQEITDTPPTHSGGQVSEHDIKADYITALTASVRLDRSISVAIDCGNGATGGVAGDVFRALGCTVTELYSDVDGNFPNHHPDPAVAENMATLSACVTHDSHALGLAFDGDGDRLGVLNEAGQPIAADRQMMAFAESVLATHSAASVVYDVKCSSGLGDVIRAAGGVPVLCKTGHANLKSSAREHDAPLAGELSGHILFADRWYGFDDALYAGARMLELAARRDAPVSSLFAAYPVHYTTDELFVPCHDADPHAVSRRLVDCGLFDDADVLTLDGLRVEFADGWGLVRASNTTPNLVLRFEGKSHAALIRIRDLILQALTEVAPALTLPDQVLNADVPSHERKTP